jgi:hypothetical protein
LLPSAISIAGASSDQKLAAIITPAAKPSIASNTLRFTALVKKTPARPRAVSPHVNSVAKSACATGERVCAGSGILNDLRPAAMLVHLTL